MLFGLFLENPIAASNVQIAWKSVTKLQRPVFWNNDVLSCTDISLKWLSWKVHQWSQALPITTSHSRCQQVPVLAFYVALGPICSVGVVLWTSAVLYSLCALPSEIALQRCINCGTRSEYLIAYTMRDIIFMTNTSFVWFLNESILFLKHVFHTATKCFISKQKQYLESPQPRFPAN